MAITKEDLLAQLKLQTKLLSADCLAFDKGDQDYGLAIAHKLRVILHQTSSSHSLISLLGKENEQFLTSSQKDPVFFYGDGSGKIISNQYLLLREKFGTDGNFLSYTPLFDDLKNPSNTLSFNDWWKNDPILIYDNGDKTLTRKKLVVDIFSNKLGGSHVDPNISDDISDIQKLDFKIMGFTKRNKKGEDVPFTDSPFLATIRQVAHEVLRSCNNIFSNQLDIEFKYGNNIEKYKIIGHNKSPWELSPGGQIFDETHNSVFVQFNNTSANTAMFMSSEEQLSHFDLAQLDYGIISENSKITLSEKGILMNDKYDYQEDDRHGFVICRSNDVLKVFYLHKEKVMYESHMSPNLPLYLHFALQKESIIGNPQVRPNSVIENGRLKIP